MGSFFTLYCIIFLVRTGLIYAQPAAIELPQNPRSKAIAPQPDIEEINERINIREELLREKTDRAGITKPSVDFGGKQQQQLLEIATTPAKLRLGVTAHIAYMKMQTTGSARKNYNAEPSTSLAALYRITGPEHASRWQAWTGMRLSGIQGSGSYNGIHGRFGYLYVGPLIAAGYFSETALDLPAENTNAAASGSSSISSVRYGYFFNIGINGVSKSSTTEKEKPKAEEDFDNQAFAFDAPGVQAEGHALWMKYNSVSIGLVAGILLAKQKNYYYAGISCGAWN